MALLLIALFLTLAGGMAAFLGVTTATIKLAAFAAVLGVVGLWLTRAIADHDDRRLLYKLFAAAFLLRLLMGLVLLHVIPQWVPQDDPYLALGFLTDDGILYDAQGISALQNWESGGSPLEDLSTNAKGYILANTLVYKLLGHELFGVRVLNAFLGALVPVFAFAIARNLLVRRYAMLAAVLVALYPTLIVYSADHGKDTSVTAAFVVGLWAVVQLASIERFRRLAHLAGALVMVIAYLAVSRFYLIFILLGALFISAGRNTRGQAWVGQMAIKTSLAAAGLIAMLLVFQYIPILNASMFENPLGEAAAFYAGIVRPQGSDSFYSILEPPFNFIMLPVAALFTLLNPFILWPFLYPEPLYWVLLPGIIAWYILLPVALYGMVVSRKEQVGTVLAAATIMTLFLLALSGSGLVTSGRTQLPLQPIWLIFAAVGIRDFLQGKIAVRRVLTSYAAAFLAGMAVYLLVKDLQLLLAYLAGVTVVLLVWLIAWTRSRRDSASRGGSYSEKVARLAD